MKHFAIFVLASLLAAPAGFAAGSGDEVVARLNASKHTLLQGIAQAEKAHGKAISAKFEMKGETLMLSVYTARAGLGNDAEHNELIELLGDASQANWTPAIEVFADAEHLKRSAMHLTLVQTSRLSLVDAVRKTESATRGKVYSAIPSIRAGVPVYDIALTMPDGKSRQMSIDGSSGNSRER
jgi:hypothetical protein